VQPAPPAPDGESPTRSLRLRALVSPILSNRQALVGLGVIVFFVAVALIGPLLMEGDPKEKVGPVFDPPSREYPLGTDGGGASMLALLVDGARVSLLVGFAAALISAVIGGTVGIASGFFGGKTDTALMRVTDYFLVIPDIPLMIVVAALFGRSLTNIIVIIGIIYWTFTARLLRAQTKTVKERVYVQRARALGAGNARLIFRHVLPQVTPLLIANTVLLIALAIFAETFITFLGLGDPSVISWGRLIENAFTDDAIINEAWWAIIPPGVCVTLVVLACTLMGQAMEDALNPRLRSGHLSVHRFRVLPRVEGTEP
jgi:peptide/nickel transport system permease protein